MQSRIRLFPSIRDIVLPTGRLGDEPDLTRQMHPTLVRVHRFNEIHPTTNPRPST